MKKKTYLVTVEIFEVGITSYVFSNLLDAKMALAIIDKYITFHWNIIKTSINLLHLNDSIRLYVEGKISLEEINPDIIPHF